MVDRRGFIASLLAAPLVGKVAAKTTPHSALGAMSDSIKAAYTAGSALYRDRMWFTSRDGVHVYYSDVHDPE